MDFKSCYNSPLGKIILKSDGEFLTGLWFENSKDNIKNACDTQEKSLSIFDQTKLWLDEYFGGNIPTFTPKYKFENQSPFKLLVWSFVEKIPYGKTITYGDIAKEIAKIKHIDKMSAQAVGGAVGANPICLIVPCHRVVGANNKLVGYGGGIENKIKLLKLENETLLNS